MREVLLILIVASISLAAVLRPRWGFFGYVWFALMRPDVLAWSDDGRYPYSLVLAVATLLGSWAHLLRVTLWFRNPITLGLISLQLPILISIIVAVDSSLAQEAYPLYLRVVVMTLLAPLLIETKEHLKWYVIVMSFSVGFLGLKWGVFGILAGGARFVAGYGGFYSDNNTLALALAMAVPMCWHAAGLRQHWIYKAGCIGFAACTMAAVIMTYSRGAAVSMAVACLLIAWRSRHRVVVLGFMTALAFGFSLMIWESYSDRLSTLTSIDTEGSAYSRIEYSVAAIKMWFDHPLFGVGFGSTNYVLLAPQYLGRATAHVVHNTYIQMLVDSGIFAFLGYVALLFGSIYWIGRAAKWYASRDSTMRSACLAMRDGLVTFAIGSLALSRVSFDLMYFLLTGVAAVYLLRKEEREERAEPERAPAPVAASAPAVPVAAPAFQGSGPRQPMWAKRRPQ